MASIRKKHEDFIKEIQAPLKCTTDAKPPRFKVMPVEDEATLTEEEIQKALESKFDKLFGPIVDDDDDEEGGDGCTWE